MPEMRAFLVFVVACTKPAPPPAPPTIADSAAPDVAVVVDAAPDVVVDAAPEDSGIEDADLTVNFGPCMGNCPRANYVLRSDGTLTGGRTKTLEPAETKKIFDQADAALATECTHPLMPDHQVVTVTLRRGKKTRSKPTCTELLGAVAGRVESAAKR